jgi:hypothetical protein
VRVNSRNSREDLNGSGVVLFTDEFVEVDGAGVEEVGLDGEVWVLPPQAATTTNATTSGEYRLI